MGTGVKLSLVACAAALTACNAGDFTYRPRDAQADGTTDATATDRPPSDGSADAAVDP